MLEYNNFNPPAELVDEIVDRHEHKAGFQAAIFHALSQLNDYQFFLMSAYVGNCNLDKSVCLSNDHFEDAMYHFWRRVTRKKATGCRDLVDRSFAISSSYMDRLQGAHPIERYMQYWTPIKPNQKIYATILVACPVSSNFKKFDMLTDTSWKYIDSIHRVEEHRLMDAVSALTNPIASAHRYFDLVNIHQNETRFEVGDPLEIIDFVERFQGD